MYSYCCETNVYVNVVASVAKNVLNAQFNLFLGLPKIRDANVNILNGEHICEILYLCNVLKIR